MFFTIGTKQKISEDDSVQITQSSSYSLFARRRIQPTCTLTGQSKQSDAVARQLPVVTRMKEALNFPHAVHGLVRTFSCKSSLPDLVRGSSLSPSSSGGSLSTTASDTQVQGDAWAEPKIKGVLKKSAKSEPDLRKANKLSRKRTPTRLHHVQFGNAPSIHHTYSKTQYDRQTDQDAVCLHLTVDVAGAIKHELNSYKMTEMQVHEESRIYTHYLV